MDPRVVRSGFQRVSRLVTINTPRALPLRPVWPRPKVTNTAAAATSSVYRRVEQFHSGAVDRAADSKSDRVDRYSNEGELATRLNGEQSHQSSTTEEQEDEEQDEDEQEEDEQEGEKAAKELGSALNDHILKTLEEAIADAGTPGDRDLNIPSEAEIASLAPALDDEFDPRDLAEISEAEKEYDPARNLRIVPASPSYFTAQPRFTDDMLRLTALVRAHTTLPTVPAGDAPRINWLTYLQYSSATTEPVRKSRYARLVRLLQRLNQIHPALMPGQVSAELARWKRAVQPAEQERKPAVVDGFGRSRAVGRRKSSHAVVWLVEGDGQVRVNGRALNHVFARLHDRESALWPLKATARVDRYNVWAVVKGGGTTGQAEAVTLGLAKALLVQEPALKPALRRAGCVRTDPRQVERKKPGHLKARKMPAWVRR